MKKVTWAKGWGIMNLYREDGCLESKLCHYNFLLAYQGKRYEWHGISLEQYQAILSGKQTIESVWSEIK